MNKRVWILVSLGAAAICLFLATRPVNPLWPEMAAGNSKVQASRQEDPDHGNGAAPFRTKAADRPFNSPRHTHSPERLREFMLPAVVIEGLSLEDALQKLRTSYEEACRKTGETPLPLTFTIPPPGTTRKLTIHLPAGSFTSSVQLLATLSVMKVSRKGLEYQFEPLAGERKQVSRELQVSPDFNTALNEMAGFTNTPDPDPFAPEASIVPNTVSDCLAALGLDLDPSTHLTLGPFGTLTLETTSAADAAAIPELVKTLNEQPHTQLKFNSKILELPAGVEWTAPDGSQLTDHEVQTLMREISQKNGVDLLTFPNTIARSGQSATIEMTREVIYPSDDGGKSFETRNVGKAVDLMGGLLGFGQELALNYTDTTVEFDPSTGKPSFNKRTAMLDKGVSEVGGTRFIVQTRPDGSRTVLLLSATMIDATGRPLH